MAVAVRSKESVETPGGRLSSTAKMPPGVGSSWAHRPVHDIMPTSVVNSVKTVSGGASMLRQVRCSAIADRGLAARERAAARALGGAALRGSLRGALERVEAVGPEVGEEGATEG